MIASLINVFRLSKKSFFFFFFFLFTSIFTFNFCAEILVSASHQNFDVCEYSLVVSKQAQATTAGFFKDGVSLAQDVAKNNPKNKNQKSKKIVFSDAKTRVVFEVDQKTGNISVKELTSNESIALVAGGQVTFDCPTVSIDGVLSVTAPRVIFDRNVFVGTLVCEANSLIQVNGAIGTKDDLVLFAKDNNARIFINTGGNVDAKGVVELCVPQGMFEAFSGIVLGSENFSVKARTYSVHRASPKKTITDRPAYKDRDDDWHKCESWKYQEASAPAILGSYSGTVFVDTDSFTQTASVLVGRRDVDLNIHKSFSNNAHSNEYHTCVIKKKCESCYWGLDTCSFDYPTYETHFSYIPSIIGSRSGNTVVRIDGKRECRIVQKPQKKKICTDPSFLNTGVVQAPGGMLGMIFDHQASVSNGKKNGHISDWRPNILSDETHNNALKKLSVSPNQPQDDVHKTLGLLEGKKYLFYGPQADFENYGVIQAKEKITIEAKTLKNQTGDVSRVYKIRTDSKQATIKGLDIEVKTSGAEGIKNIGGSIFAVHTINMIAQNGNIENIPEHVTCWNTDHHAKMFGKQNSKATLELKGSSIVAGGDLSLTSEVGKIINAASGIAAGGKVTLKARAGVLIDTILSTVREKTRHGAFDKIRVYEASVFGGNGVAIVSSHGQNQLNGANITSGKKIYLKAARGNKLGAVSTHVKSVFEKVSWFLFGVGYNQKKQDITYIHQTKLKAAENIVLESDLDNILEAVITHAGGVIHVVAARNNIFKGVDQVTVTDTKDYSFAVSFFGSESIKDVVAGEKSQAILSLAKEDPLLRSLLQFSDVKKWQDGLAQTEYVGLEGLRLLLNYAQAKQLSKDGIVNKKAFLGQRLGITTPDGKFSPQLRFHLAYKNTHDVYTQTVPTEFNAMRLVTKSGAHTAFDDGAKVTTSEQTKITAETVSSSPAKDTHVTTESGVDVGVAVSSQGATLDVSVSHTESESVHHTQAEIVTENFELDAKTATFSGTKVQATTSSVHVEKVILDSPQDTERSETWAGGVVVGLDGSVGGHVAHSESCSAQTTFRTLLGLGVVSGHMGEVDMTAADIEASAGSTLEVDHVTGHTQKDFTSESGFNVRVMRNAADVLEALVDGSVKNKRTHAEQRAFIDQFVKVVKGSGVVRDPSQKTSETVVDSDRYFRLVVPVPNQERFSAGLTAIKDLFAGEPKEIATEKIKSIVDDLEDLKEYTEKALEEGLKKCIAEETPIETSEQTDDKTPEQQEQEFDTQDDPSDESFATQDENGDILDHIINDSSSILGEHVSKEEERAFGDQKFTSLHGDLGGGQSLDIQIGESLAPVSDITQVQRFAVDVVENKNGGHSMAIIVGDNVISLTGSLDELTTFVTRWSMFQNTGELSRRDAVYSSMAHGSPESIAETKSWLKRTGERLVNGADWLLPVKDTWAVVSGYKDGKKLDWTERGICALKVIGSIAIAYVGGAVITKLGKPVAMWAVNTRVGRAVIEKAAKPVMEFAGKAAGVVTEAVGKMTEPVAQAASKVAAPATEAAGRVYDKAASKLAGTRIGKLLEERAFNKIVKNAGFKKIGENKWKSPAELIYGNDDLLNNRIYHVLEHGKANIVNKRIHSVFVVQKEDILRMIDNAWLSKGNVIPIIQGNRVVYNIPMNKVIGTAGETNIRLVLEGQNVITAFPFK